MTARSWDDWKKRWDEAAMHRDAVPGGTAPGKTVESSSWLDGWSTARRCYDDHPPLVLADGGPYAGLTIHGGSCIRPVVKDADAYVGFDHGMTFSHRALPWREGHEFLYEIRDQHAPRDPEDFGRLVDWVLARVLAGDRVHAGCIGGHGRTGMLLAAMVARIGEEADPIRYVRERYCHRAVETTAQVRFLTDHFGCKKVAPVKGKGSGRKKGGKGGGARTWPVLPAGGRPLTEVVTFEPDYDDPSLIWGEVGGDDADAT